MTERAHNSAPMQSSPEDIISLDQKIPIQIAEGVFLIRGAKRGAICDTNTGNVYSINPSAVEVILGRRDDLEYQQQLRDLNLMSTIAEVKPAEIEKKPINLDFVWFEIVSDDCNESCAHCYADSMSSSHRKALGLLTPGEDSKSIDIRPKLSFEDWQKMLKEAYDLGCRQCQFIGGEPFVYHEGQKRVLDLATYAKELGYETVEIFTNATLITPADILRIKKLGINIAVSL